MSVIIWRFPECSLSSVVVWNPSGIFYKLSYVSTRVLESEERKVCFRTTGPTHPRENMKDGKWEKERISPSVISRSLDWIIHSVCPTHSDRPVSVNRLRRGVWGCKYPKAEFRNTAQVNWLSSSPKTCVYMRSNGHRENLGLKISFKLEITKFEDLRIC